MHKTLKFVDISGYGHSGKSAVSDFLKHADCVFSFPNNVEFELIRVPNGLLDLYSAIHESWNIIRSTHKIKEFKKLINRIGTTPNIKKPWTYLNSSGHSYEKLFNYNFINESNKFISNLIIEKNKSYWPYDNLTNSNIELVFNKLKYKFFNTLIKSEIYYTKSSNFQSEIENYLNALFNHLVNLKQTHVVLSNAFEPYNPELTLKMIKGAKSIIVHRDPRDIFASQINSNEMFVPNFEKFKNIDKIKSEMTHFNDISKFITRFKILHENSTSNTESVMKIQFEDFVLNFNTVSSKILDFLEINPSSINDKFDITNSIKNVGIWEKYKDLKEIRIIERELNKYCFKN